MVQTKQIVPYLHPPSSAAESWCFAEAPQCVDWVHKPAGSKSRPAAPQTEAPLSLPLTPGLHGALETHEGQPKHRTTREWMKGSVEWSPGWFPTTCARIKCVHGDKSWCACEVCMDKHMYSWKQNKCLYLNITIEPLRIPFWTPNPPDTSVSAPADERRSSRWCLPSTGSWLSPTTSQWSPASHYTHPNSRQPEEPR